MHNTPYAILVGTLETFEEAPNDTNNIRIKSKRFAVHAFHTYIHSYIHTFTRGDRFARDVEDGKLADENAHAGGE